MKWRLFVMVCLMMGCIAGSMAWSDNMNNGERAYTCIGDGYQTCTFGPGFNYNINSAYSDTYGANVNSNGDSANLLSPVVGTPLSYVAATMRSSNPSGGPIIDLRTFDASGNLLTNNRIGASYIEHRYEVVISGSNEYVYLDGVLSTTITGVSTYPAYMFAFGVSRYGYSPTFSYIDDLSSDNLYTDTALISAPPHTFVINRDLLSTITREYNAADQIVNNSYLNLQFSIGPYADGWDITNPPNTRYHVVIVSPSGKQTSDTYINFAHYNSACGIIPVQFNSSYIDNSPLEYGIYTIYLRDATTGSVRSSDYFSVTAALGSIVSWEKGTYGNGETANISYSIPTAYYNTLSYTYNIKVVDIYGTVVGTQSVSSQSGSILMPLNGVSPGVYYAELNAMPISSTTNYIMAHSATEVSAYVYLSGYVMNQENATVLSGATVTATQGSTSIAYTSASTGWGNTTQYWLTGTDISLLTTKSGYSNNTRTFKPLSAGNLPLNISLSPTTHTYTGVAIGGVVADGQYGNPITNATRHVKNGTEYTCTTNIAGWCVVNNLVNGMVYDVWSSKSGFNNSIVHKVTAVGT